MVMGQFESSETIRERLQRAWQELQAVRQHAAEEDVRVAADDAMKALNKVIRAEKD